MGVAARRTRFVPYFQPLVGCPNECDWTETDARTSDRARVLAARKRVAFRTKAGRSEPEAEAGADAVVGIDRGDERDAF